MNWCSAGGIPRLIVCNWNLKELLLNINNIFFNHHSCNGLWNVIFENVIWSKNHWLNQVLSKNWICDYMTSIMFEMQIYWFAKIRCQRYPLSVVDHAEKALNFSSFISNYTLKTKPCRGIFEHWQSAKIVFGGWYKTAKLRYFQLKIKYMKT